MCCCSRPGPRCLSLLAYMLAYMACITNCGGASPAPANEPEQPKTEPTPETTPETTPEPTPEAGNVKMSSAFIVGGDMPALVRDEITEQVVQAIMDATPLFRRCYARSVVRGTTPSGRIDIEMVIEPGGSIALLRAGKGTLTDRGLVRCTVRAFKHLSLPSPPANYSIVAPMYYDPE